MGNPNFTGMAAGQPLSELLSGYQAFQKLDPSMRNEIVNSLSTLSTFLSNQSPPDPPIARQMAPDLAERMRNQQSGGSSNPYSGTSPGGYGGTGGSSPTSPTPPPSGGATSGGGGTVGRAGEVARATLNAIDFPSFVGALIQGTFQAIVDSSIQQMEAYATLLKNVAGTVDRFMQDNISDGMARDHLADQFPGVVSRRTDSGNPKLSLQSNRDESPLPGFFQDLGFQTSGDLNDEALEQVVVPAARRQLAEARQQTLATMVLMGINRVVVDDGEISAKLQFHIDAAETMQMRFDQTKTTAGNMSGYAGRSPFGAQSVMVNTTSLNAQTDINVRADLTGQVKVKFRSETFPLERFADSAAIQLINSNAKVPSAPPSTTTGGTTGSSTVPAGTPSTATPGGASPAPVTTPSTQQAGLSSPLSANAPSESDPWAPEI